ncbi:hypothetical protein [Paractinoplanes globisporus]|uniref:Transposase n=1 Tax=Paractinoplanes globisporus TaxID=113565 RepID=A0ABW6WK72_9ACTN|nr:hypothetical protein [Actinoplanes globisporus]
MRIAVSFALDVPDDSIAALCELAAVEPCRRTRARRFVQAEAEQNLITYLEDNGITVRPVRGVAFPSADYPAREASS